MSTGGMVGGLADTVRNVDAAHRREPSEIGSPFGRRLDSVHPKSSVAISPMTKPLFGTVLLLALYLARIPLHSEEPAAPKLGQPWGLANLPSAAQLVSSPESRKWFNVLFPQGVSTSSQTDIFSFAYVLAPKSISPDRHYGVLIPRFELIEKSPAILVDLNARQFVGMLSADTFPIPENGRATADFQWSSDSTSFVWRVFRRVQEDWQLSEARGLVIEDGRIARGINLLPPHKPSQSWLAGACSYDATGLVTLDLPTAPATASSRITWDPKTDKANRTPLEKGGFPQPNDFVPEVFTPEPLTAQQSHVLATAPDETFLLEWKNDQAVFVVSAKDHAQRVELTIRGAPGKGLNSSSAKQAGFFPICFISPDSKYIFVNSIVNVDTATGRQTRSGCLYRRIETEESVLPRFEPVSEPLEELAWKSLSKADRLLKPNSLVDRSIFFQAWSDSSARLLFQIRALPAKSPGHVLRFACFGISRSAINEPLSFEVHEDGPLFEINRHLRSRDKSAGLTPGDFDLSPLTHQTFIPDLEKPSQLFTAADEQLNAVYSKLLTRLDSTEQEALKKQQIAWLRERETIAWVHALQSWAPLPAARLVEGRAAATYLRVQQLAKRLLPLIEGNNWALREVSPDTRFAVRYHYADDDFQQQFSSHRVELLDQKSGQVVLPLYDAQAEQESPVTVSVLWSPDSRRFAFWRSFKRVAEATIFQLADNGFEAHPIPEFENLYPTTAGLVERKFISGNDHPDHWVDNSHLVIQRTIDILTETKSGELAGDIIGNYRILLRVKEDGGSVVEKVLSQKTTRTND